MRPGLAGLVWTPVIWSNASQMLALFIVQIDDSVFVVPLINAAVAIFPAFTCSFFILIYKTSTPWSGFAGWSQSKLARELKDMCVVVKRPAAYTFNSCYLIH